MPRPPLPSAACLAINASGEAPQFAIRAIPNNRYKRSSPHGAAVASIRMPNWIMRPVRTVGLR